MAFFGLLEAFNGTLKVQPRTAAEEKLEKEAGKEVPAMISELALVSRGSFKKESWFIWVRLS